MVRLASLVLAGGLAAGILVITSWPPPGGQDVVARVNGESITRADLAAYEEDLVSEAAPGEARSVALLSLINQAVVRQEARRLGITVSEELVQAQVEAALANPTIGRSLRSNSAIDTFRERTRMRLLSEAVRGAVIPSPQTSDTDVERELMADASTNGDPQDVEAAIRTRLSAKATGEAWVRWLGSRRACASVVILDAGLALPPTAAYACD